MMTLTRNKKVVQDAGTNVTESEPPETFIGNCNPQVLIVNNYVAIFNRVVG